MRYEPSVNENGGARLRRAGSTKMLFDATHMFGLFKKRIPAPQPEREQLVKRLYIHRCQTDPASRMNTAIMGEDPADAPIDVLIAGSPEATILGVVEQFYSMRDQGMTEEFSVKTLNEMHAAMVSMVGQSLPQMGHPVTLFQYLRHIVDTLHGHGLPIGDAYLIDAMQEIKSHYRR